MNENVEVPRLIILRGAPAVGKSTIAEEFAKNEFKSYILIDFAHTSKEITGLFDEVQLLPKARQAIKLCLVRLQSILLIMQIIRVWECH